MPLLLAKGSTGEQSKGVRTDMAKDELLLLRKELQEVEHSKSGKIRLDAWLIWPWCSW